jgi:hypothetical protein
MQAASLDILEKTQLPPTQARAILQVMELEITARGETFVGRNEMREAFFSLKLEMGGLRSDFEKLRGEVHAEIEALRGEVDAKIGAVRAEIETVRGEIKAVEGRLMRWVFSCILGQTAVMAGALYFALTHFRP